jgi:hypothetical protein
MLEKKDPIKAHAICDSVVKSMTDYSYDPGVLRAARAKIVKELAQD